MNRTLVKCPPWMAAKIKAEGGVVPFAKYMDWYLNDPKNGSYGSGKIKIGIKGDFVTSPSLGGDFCDLLSVQVADWIFELDSQTKNDTPISIIDIGPGEGHLSFYLISSLLKNYPSIENKFNLILVEINPGMIIRQKKFLSSFKNVSIKWTTFEELSKSPVRGVMIAHELLDALPVDRIMWKNNQLALQGVELVEINNKPYISYCDIPLSDHLKISIDHFSKAVDLKIPPKNAPNGWISEWHSALDSWFKNASSCLIEGPLLIIDYALEAIRYYDISRKEGTLISFKNQKVNKKFLEDVGNKDITSHLCLEKLFEAASNASFSFIGERKQGLALLALGLSEKINLLKNIPNNKLDFALKSRESLLRLVDPICLGDFRWILFKKFRTNQIKQLQNDKFLLDP